MFCAYNSKLHTSCRTWIKNNFHQTVYRYMLWYRNSITTSERNQFLTPWVYLSSLFSQSNDAKFDALLPSLGLSTCLLSLTRRMAGGGQTVDAEGRKETLIRKNVRVPRVRCNFRHPDQQIHELQRSTTTTCDSSLWRASEIQGNKHGSLVQILNM